MASVIHLRVPASTSNLGPGFDVLGMAVDRYLEVRFEGPASEGGKKADSGAASARSAASGPEQGELLLTRTGTLTALDARPPEADLLVQALVAGLGHRPAGRLSVHSEIPVGQGLGSSAAARAGGYALAALLQDEALNPQALLEAVARDEGHPDNAVPAVVGGLVAARMAGLDTRGRGEGVEGGPVVEWRRYPVSDALAWVFAAPSTPLDTAASRRVVPEQVDRADAVSNLARIPLLLSALAEGDGPGVARNLRDRLHVPYRLPLVPGGHAALRAGREAGAWGVTLSGAGSGLLAVTPPDRAAAVRDAMARAFREAGEEGGAAFVLRPESEGLRVSSPRP